MSKQAVAEKTKQKAVLFTNYSDKDFTHKWDSVEYAFPKGQSMMLESALCLHFAKHLATRELNIAGTITSKLNIVEEMKKAIGTTTIEAEDKTKLHQEAMNYNKLKKGALVEAAEEKGIETQREDGKAKNKDELVDELEGFEGKD